MCGELALGPDLIPPPPVENVRRIAVLRANGIGDYVTSEPALAALRATYPEAEITLLGAAHHRVLVEDRPGPCDRFVPVPLMPGVRAGSAPDATDDQIDAFFAAEQAHGYDLAVGMHGGGRNSNRLLARLGARATAGACTPDAPRLDRWIPYSPNTHEILRWLDVAAACGAPAVRRAPHVAVTDADLAEADDVLAHRLAAARLPRGRCLIAIHPGATDPRRRWPVERHVAVAAALAEVNPGSGPEGATIVLLGAPSERLLVDEAGAAAAERDLPVVDLCGALSLGGLLGLLARANLLLGNDSGPRHLAEAVGTPTVGVFTNANLADVAPLSRVWHRIAVSWTSRCVVCDRPVQQACDHDATALDDVSVDEVRELAEDLWRQVDDVNPLPVRLRGSSERRKEAPVPASPTEAA